MNQSSQVQKSISHVQLVQQQNRKRSSSSSVTAAAVVSANSTCMERLRLKIEVGLESSMLDVPPNAPPGTHTHRWTVFLRLPDGQPFDTNLIQKVVFQLHEDFPNPKRTVNRPPFQVTETGYAGFNIPLYLFFTNCRKEYYLEYDMNLRYEPYFKIAEVRMLDFVDPKPDLRSRLLKAGAEIVSNRKVKISNERSVTPAVESESESFTAVFGETLRFTNRSQAGGGGGSVVKMKKMPEKSQILKAPSKPLPTKPLDSIPIRPEPSISTAKVLKPILTTEKSDKTIKKVSKKPLKEFGTNFLKHNAKISNAVPSLPVCQTSTISKSSSSSIEKLSTKNVNVDHHEKLINSLSSSSSSSSSSDDNVKRSKKIQKNESNFDETKKKKKLAASNVDLKKCKTVEQKTKHVTGGDVTSSSSSSKCSPLCSKLLDKTNSDCYSPPPRLTPQQTGHDTSSSSSSYFISTSGASSCLSGSNVEPPQPQPPPPPPSSSSYLNRIDRFVDSPLTCDTLHSSSSCNNSPASSSCDRQKGCQSRQSTTNKQQHHHHHHHHQRTTSSTIVQQPKVIMTSTLNNRSTPVINNKVTPASSAKVVATALKIDATMTKAIQKQKSTTTTTTTNVKDSKRKRPCDDSTFLLDKHENLPKKFKKTKLDHKSTTKNRRPENPSRLDSMSVSKTTVASTVNHQSEACTSAEITSCASIIDSTRRFRSIEADNYENHQHDSINNNNNNNSSMYNTISSNNGNHNQFLPSNQIDSRHENHSSKSVAVLSVPKPRKASSSTATAIGTPLNNCISNSIADYRSKCATSSSSSSSSASSSSSSVNALKSKHQQRKHQIDQDDQNEMLALQRRIMDVQDAKTAQTIVDLLTDYRQPLGVTRDAVEFDLYALNRNVLDRLSMILNGNV